METTSIFLSALLVVLLLNGCSASDLKVNVSTKSGLDLNSSGTGSSNERTGGSDLGTNDIEIHKFKVDKGNQVNKLKDGISIKNDTNKSNTIRQSDSKETDNMKKNNGVANEEPKAKNGNNKEDNPINEKKSKQLPKKGGNDGDSDQLRKDGTQVEECDSSYKCMDESKLFVACLRVPGNDSPELSLLIQNKVKGSLTVTISAPDYVQLEKKKIQLHEKGGDELKVSVKSRGTDNSILIMSGTGNCSLDFRDIIAQNSEEEFANSLKSTYFNFLSQKPTIVFVFFAALLILALGCICASLQRRQLSTSASKYLKLDMELPITNAGKSESDTNNGWDNSWGDDWDDEETPKIPPLPVTPILSAKGLASRRLNKDGWKA